MAPFLRTLLCGAFALALVVGPAFLAAPSLSQCSTNADHLGATDKAANAADCCEEHSDSEMSCCRRPNPAGEHAPSPGHCGSSPAGKCPCCDACHGLVIAAMLSDNGDRLAPPPVASVLVASESLDSRTDRPLLPPPIV